MGIRIHPDKLGDELRRRARQLPGVITRGLNAGARQAKVLLQKRTPVGATAKMKNSWKMRPGVKGSTPEIFNEAPHAGIVELGARPHPVSQEGIASLTHWARRKLGLPPDEARSVAHAIAAKIRRHGQVPTYFVRDSMGEIQVITAKAVNRAISKVANRKAR